MADETIFQTICRYAELVRARESELGSYPGDGPTAEQADALVASLRPISALPNSASPKIVLAAFHSAVDAEMAWVFPESDPIGKPLCAALREVQRITGEGLETVGPGWRPRLEHYVSLAIAANAAKRQMKLKGNGISWRRVLARFLWWLGGGKR